VALVELLKDAYNEWSEDNAPRLGAALAYYTVFSVTPLIILSIAVVGLAFGEEAARGQVITQIRGLVGEPVASAVQAMIAQARSKSSGILATVVGVGTLLFGASGVFTELQASMNTIWDAPPKPWRGVWGLIKDRFFSFTMVLGTGFLLLVSLVVSAVIAAASAYFQHLLPTAFSQAAVYAVDLGSSLAVITVLFAVIFKMLPEVSIRWGDVWAGAFLTAVLFTIGKFFIGLYLGRSSVTSMYGAAGSLIVLLLWVYYSAQILFFGAEFTQVYAKRYGPQPAQARTAPAREARDARAA